MNTGRVKAPLIDYIEVNPRETIIKGSMAKKIGIDKLRPFAVIFYSMNYLNMLEGLSSVMVIPLWLVLHLV